MAVTIVILLFLAGLLYATRLLASGPARDDREELAATEVRARSRVETMSGINQLTLEQLAELPEWMVPPSRKADLQTYLARKRRGVEGPAKSAEEEQKEIEEARIRAGLMPDGTRVKRFGVGQSFATRLGPRGGRYTEARTRDGRPYRRYF